jgi:GNAT superfamily N-acetyltransferase
VSALVIREALEADLSAIVGMIADDDKGRSREDISEPLNPGYRAAFDAIAGYPNQHLLVAELDGALVGTFQLSFLVGLSQRGAWRGQIEAVRIARAQRGQGLGREMIEWAISRCRARGCRMVQLTTHESRGRAHSFYERLGFEPSHIGMKLHLSGANV